MHDSITLDRNYTFTISNYSWGDLDVNWLRLMFRDGRICTPFIQLQLPIWFPELMYVNESGYDHIGLNNQKYEHKSFTKGGCIFAPSNMVGKGRQMHPNLVVEHIKKTNLIYIITGITEFPKILVRFVDGTKLINMYPACKISKKAHDSFFNLTSANSVVRSNI